MLSTGSATDKAEATKIISNLRSLKSASLMRYADTSKWPSGSNTVADLASYMDQALTATMGYSFVGGGSADVLYITFASADVMTAGVRNKLKDIARDSGLREGASSADYAGGNTVGMIIKN